MFTINFWTTFQNMALFLFKNIFTQLNILAEKGGI